MEDQQMTVKQAAVHLGVTTRTVRLWIESGRLQGERVEGKFGPEWRLDREEVLGAADRRSAEPLAVDTAGKPGGNALRALVSVLDAELRKIQESQAQHHQYLLALSERLATFTRTLPSAGDDAALQGLIRQSAQVQTTIEEESRAQRRGTQELHAVVQALSAAIHDQSEQVRSLTEEIHSLRARRPWYRRLLDG